GLERRKLFSVPVESIPEFKWYQYRELYSARLVTPLTVTFASVATHNHFALDRGGRLFNRHAPVIKLPDSAVEDDHQALLGVLNSSTACFWLKQVCQPKGGSGLGRGVQDEAWEVRYEFTGTRLKKLPLPSALPRGLGCQLDLLAHRL